jgi:hypothetical protein
MPKSGGDARNSVPRALLAPIAAPGSRIYRSPPARSRFLDCIIDRSAPVLCTYTICSALLSLLTWCWQVAPARRFAHVP